MYVVTPFTSFTILSISHILLIISLSSYNAIYAVLYYFDQVFTGCDLWRLVFTARGVHQLPWPVTWTKIVQCNSVHSLGKKKFLSLYLSRMFRPSCDMWSCPKCSVQFVLWHMTWTLGRNSTVIPDVNPMFPRTKPTLIILWNVRVLLVSWYF